MAFRRQDIPKTTRKGEEGQPRRLYPRFAKDRALLPKVELAIGYLDGMVGRRRGDLSPDVVLELFGDPKLARCVLASLADSYRYRSQTVAEVVGEEAAHALAGWDLFTAADLRGYVYLAANDRLGGFVADADRPAFLAEVAEPLGLTVAQLEELLHLDAERNALLIRVGERPRAEDVVARYNATLVYSVVRHASSVELDLPGLDGTTIETVCARHDVGFRRLGEERVRLAGRRNALGSWATFGGRVARCALHLLLLAPRAPGGTALVHLNGQPLSFVLDGFAVGAVRPKLRAVAGADGVVRSAVLADAVGALRRQVAGGANGWTMRRASEPIVVEGALALPELVFTRDDVAVPVVPVPDGPHRASAIAALTELNRTRPVVALGADLPEIPSLALPDAAALIDLLDEIAEGRGATTPLGIVGDEVATAGWIAAPRLAEILGGTDDLADRLHPLTADGDAAFVPGFGVCRVALLDELLDRLPPGRIDVAAVRTEVAARVGEGPGADALTLHLLSRHAVVGPIGAVEDERSEEAA
jgi:hypothetical protein